MNRKIWYMITVLIISACGSTLPTMIYMKGAETFMVDYNGDGRYDAEWLSLDRANRMSYTEVVRYYIDPGLYRWAKTDEMALLYGVLGVPGNSNATRQMESIAGIELRFGQLYTGNPETARPGNGFSSLSPVISLGWYGGSDFPALTEVDAPRYFPALIRTGPGSI